MTEPLIPWVRIALAFLFCIGLAVAAILVLRWRQGTGGGVPPRLAAWLHPADRAAPSQPELLGRLRLSPMGQVVVVQWEDARYLVHVSTAGAQLLDRRPIVEPTA